MRFYKLFYLSLVCVVLSWSACEDETGTPECFPELPEIPITSSDNCTPILVRFNNLLEVPAVDAPALPTTCASANELGRIAKLEIPSGNTMDLHVYNGTLGTISVQVFGATDCDMDLTAVTPCLDVFAVADVLSLAGLNSYDELYVRIDFPNKPEPEDFIFLAAYENSPVGEEIDYQGTGNGESRLFKSCDGLSFQRLILSSCDVSLDIDAWAAETGLPVSERYEGAGGKVTAVEVPGGIDPNIVNPVVARRRIDQDNDDYIVESDHIIFAPGGTPGQLPDAGQFIDQEISTLVNCLAFNLNSGAQSSENTDGQVLVTMIDSGVELGGSWDGIWDNHRNQAYADIFVSPGDLGFDFWDGDVIPDDLVGHGTNTGGALIGNHDGEAPLTVIHHKIFGPAGEATYFGALVAIYSATDLGSNVINCSWGYVDPVLPQGMQCAVGYAVNSGVTVVASAGNNMTNITIGENPQWPASFSEVFPGGVITVASYQYEGSTASPAFPDFPILSPLFSNFGTPFSRTVTAAGYLTFQTPMYGGTDFNYLAGTSISAPLISTAAAASIGVTGDLSDFFSSLNQSTLFGDRVEDNYFLPICPNGEI